MSSLSQFETEALKLNAHITDVKQPDGVVKTMTGIIAGKNYTWNKTGRCYRAKKRVPEYDLNLKSKPV